MLQAAFAIPPADLTVSVHIGAGDQLVRQATHLRDQPLAAGIVKSDGKLWARVYFDRGYTWFTLDDTKTGELGTSSPSFVMPTLPTVTEGQAGRTILVNQCDSARLSLKGPPSTDLAKPSQA